MVFDFAKGHADLKSDEAIDAMLESKRAEPFADAIRVKLVGNPRFYSPLAAKLKTERTAVYWKHYYAGKVGNRLPLEGLTGNEPGDCLQQAIAGRDDGLKEWERMHKRSDPAEHSTTA